MRVLSQNEDDENYWKGEVDGKIGLFPKDFVKSVSPKKTSKETECQPAKGTPYQEAIKTSTKSRKEIEDDSREICKVLYNYEAENDDELTIKQKEVQILLGNI